MISLLFCCMYVCMYLYCVYLFVLIVYVCIYLILGIYLHLFEIERGYKRNGIFIG